MTTIRAAYYARVSSEQQAAAHTIESQISALSERARSDGTPVPPERQFVDDGISGATLARPALDRLRDLAAVGAIDRIYVHSPDRLARNYASARARKTTRFCFWTERAKFMERSRRGKRHAAQGGSLNVMSGAPFGYRYVSVREGGGKARFEPNAEQARVVQRIFSWIGRDRCSLHEVCRRLHKAGELTASGRRLWSKQAVRHILQNPAYVGRAAYGKTRMMPRTRKTRPRPPRGRPAEPRRSNTPVAVDAKEWVFVPVPPLVDERLFRSVQEQLEENRTRARLGRRRLGHLLQGLTCCAICGYAYSGKTTSERGQGHCLKDYRYYRCAGSDGYRFGGERICSNGQIQAGFLEAAVWREVCDLLKNPEKLEQEFKEGGEADASLQNAEALKALRLKQQHALERLIDSFTEGLIEKDQFTSRMARTKGRIAELDAQIQAYSGDIDQLEHVRLAAEQLRELSATIGPDLLDADWHRRRELIRTLVQKVEIGKDNVRIVFRVLPDAGRSGPESIAVTLPR